MLTSKPCVIKVSLKSDMAIVWLDIWNIQSGSKAKELINHCFNIGNHIATIRSTNINLGMLQCKNCWRWGHATFSYRIVKCNRPHKLEYHHHFVWCCKANNKVNPLCLETKKRKLCSYLFKCSNCQGDHQANSNQCCQKMKAVDLIYFSVLFYFYFPFDLFSIFIFRT